MPKSRIKTFHYPVTPAMRPDGPWYEIHNDCVTWRGYEVDADPDSFLALSDSWAVDATSVFVQDSKKRKIDRATFQLLNPLFAVDANDVYDWRGPLKKADRGTFEVLDSGVATSESELIPQAEFLGYARDSNGVWFHDQMEGRPSLIRAADGSSFRSLRNGYGVDQSNVFCRKAKLPGADPGTWVYLGQGYSMDHAKVWFLNREIKEANRNNFFALRLTDVTGLATDGEHYFINDAAVGKAEFSKALKNATQTPGSVMKSIDLI